MAYEKVYLSVADGCNLKCNFCYQTKGRSKMSFEVAEKSIDFIKKLKVSSCFQIYLWGGEPLLNWPIVKHLVKSYPEFKFCMFTNGLLFTEEIETFFKQQKNIEILWSIGNVDISSNAYIARYMKDTNSLINWVVEDTTDMVQKFESLINMGYRVCVDYINYKQLTKEYIESYSSAFKIINDKYGHIANMGAHWYPIARKCNAALTNLHVTPDGEIWPCDMWYENKLHKLGNIDTGVDLKEVEFFNVNNTDEFCEECEIKNSCVQKCYATNFKVNGNILKPYESHCQMRKALSKANNRPK